MARNFEFLFDFGGPNSYLAHKLLHELCARTEAEAVYVPILLGGLFGVVCMCFLQINRLSERKDDDNAKKKCADTFPSD